MDGRKSARGDNLSKLTTIDQLRERLVEEFDATPERQRLFYRGKQVSYSCRTPRGSWVVLYNGTVNVQQCFKSLSLSVKLLNPSLWGCLYYVVPPMWTEAPLIVKDTAGKSVNRIRFTVSNGLCVYIATLK